MKITFFTYHFPPRYASGGEQYANRISQQLVADGHQVEIITCEGVTDGDSLVPTVQADTYLGLPVTRLYFNLNLAPDPLRWAYQNRELGEWTRAYLAEHRPDIFHLNSGYLIGGAVAEAGFALKIPTTITLHDYWFVCPIYTLIRTDGDLCTEEVPPERCVWCFEARKRRYRMLGNGFTRWCGERFVQAGQRGWIPWGSRWGRDAAIIRDRRRYLAEVLGRIDLAVAPSQFVLDKVRQYGVSARRMEYIPLGMDTSRLHPKAGRDPDRPFQVGYLGQVAPHKGIHVLIEAFLGQHNPGPRKLSIYGKIAADNRYGQQLAARYGGDPRIEFKGAYDNARLDDMLHELDVIVVPSIWYENRPAVILEALATRTPVIASDIGGIGEIVRSEQNGLLVAPGDAAALAAALDRISLDGAFYARLQEGIEPVPTIKSEVDRLVDLWEQERAGG